MTDMDYAVAAGDNVLMGEQAALLRQCRAAISEVLRQKPMLGAMEFRCGHMKQTLGNLNAELFSYKPQGVMGESK